MQSSFTSEIRQHDTSFTNYSVAAHTQNGSGRIFIHKGTHALVYQDLCLKRLFKQAVGTPRGCQFFTKQFFFSESKNFLSRGNRLINQSRTSIIDHPKMPRFSNLLKELEAVVKSRSQKPYNKKNIS